MFLYNEGRGGYRSLPLTFSTLLKQKLQKCWQSILYFLRPKYKTWYLVSAALLSSPEYCRRFTDQNVVRTPLLLKTSPSSVDYSDESSTLAEQDWSQGGNFIKIISNWLIQAAQLCFVTLLSIRNILANFSFVKNRNDFLQQWGQNKANISRM